MKAIEQIKNQDLIELIFSPNLIRSALKMICFQLNNLLIDEAFDKNLESSIGIIKECEVLKFSLLHQDEFSFDLVKECIISLLNSKYYPKISKVNLFRK